MSKSIVEHKKTPTIQIAKIIKAASTAYSRNRTIQLQGNEALSLGVIEGYFTMTIPQTINPSVAYVNLSAPNDETVMFGNLMYSTYYPIAVGGSTPSGVSYQLGDVVGIYPTKMRWDCFLAFDDRNKGSGVLPSNDAILVTMVDSNTARITAKLQAYEPWTIPSGATPTLFVFYQLRATFFGGAL